MTGRIGTAPEPERARRRPLIPGLGRLGLASLFSGAAGYGVIALGTRTVGEVAFAPVGVLWSLWALSVAAVTFPVQHWTVRSFEAHGESAVWSQLPRLALMVATSSLAVLVACLLAGTRLFPASPIPFSIMAAMLPIGGFGVGIQRGMATAREQFRDVAFVIAGENGIRVLAAFATLLLPVSDESGAVLLGWGIVIGFGILGLRPGALSPREHAPDTGPRASFRLLGAFAGANVAAQAALTAAPVLLALFAVREAVITQVFAILALLRVPYTGFVGASAAITAPLSRLVDTGRGALLRRAELGTASTAFALAGVAHVVAPAVLPKLVALLFATEVTITEREQGLLAAGGVLAVAGLFEMLVLLAMHRPRRLLVAWGAALVAGALVLVLPLEPVLRISTAFVTAEAIALLGLVLRRDQRSDASGDDHPDGASQDLEVEHG